MSVSIDIDRAQRVATTLAQQSASAQLTRDAIAGVGDRLAMQDWCALPAALAGEIVDEVGLVADVLRAVAFDAANADKFTSVAQSDHRADHLADLLARLQGGLTDGVGGSGGDDDLRLVLLYNMLGDTPASAPAVLIDPTAWSAEHVIGPALDAGSPEDVAVLWALLSDEEQYAAIVFATAPVSDRYIASELELDDAQVFALQAQPFPPLILVDSRWPSSGPNTDWAGVELPLVPPTADPDAPPSEWVYDQDLRSFAGGSVLCSVVQVFSAIPAAPSTEGVQGAIDAGGVVWDAVHVSVPIANGAKPFSPAAWIATFADIALCRLGVGSGYPISTDKIVNENGEEVYEGSMSPTQPYMDRNGLPLSPDPRERDRQMWQAEHSHESGNYAPYPGFPAYPQNAEGYDGEPEP